MPIQLQLNRE